MPLGDVAAQRLLNHRLVGEPCQTPEAVVRWMGAIQAQDYAQSLWAVGVRTHAATVADVETALAEGKIVRTWPMRGTIHLVPADDVRWMLALCASRILSGHGYRMQQLDLSADTMARCETLFVKALSGGKRLTRADLLRQVTDAGISVEGQRGYHILWHLSHMGVLCQGPVEGKQQTFVLLDEWVPHARDLTRDEALAELTWRFFASHGPATEADFARWAGLTLTDTRQGLAMLDGRLTSADVDGRTYWMAECDTPVPAEKTVHLLPGFDEYILGYQDRSAVLAEKYSARIVPGNNGVFQPAVVVGGQVAGTWKRKIKRTSMEITLYPFEPWGDLEGDVVTEAQAYAGFWGLPVASVEVVEEPAD